MDNFLWKFTFEKFLLRSCTSAKGIFGTCGDAPVEVFLGYHTISTCSFILVVWHK